MPEAARIGDRVIQANHGFLRGSVVRFDGSDWVLGLAGNAGLGMVGDIDVDSFEFVQLGKLAELDGLEADSAPLVPGVQYFVSAGTPGALTATATASPLFRAYTASAGYVALSSTAAGSTAMASTGLTAEQLAAAIAAEVVRANAAYAAVSHTHAYLRIDDASVWDETDGTPVMFITATGVEQVVEG